MENCAPSEFVFKILRKVPKTRNERKTYLKIHQRNENVKIIFKHKGCHKSSLKNPNCKGDDKMEVSKSRNERISNTHTHTNKNERIRREKYNLGPILFLQYSSVRHVLVATMWKTRFDTLS